MEYSLIKEPWIPVVTQSGQRRLVSLTELFETAPQLARIEVESPDVGAGLYRFLLAILHAAYEGPQNLKEWEKIWKAKVFDNRRIEKYFRKWADRFDVWNEKYPFMQDPKAQNTNGPEAVTRLYVERAKGNNATLFDHSLDEMKPVISTDEAVRRLIGAQFFALGGKIAGESGSAVQSPGATAVTFLLSGENIFETLVLNLVKYDRTREPIPGSEKDLPSWERDSGIPSERAPRGYLDLLTWRPRRFKLIATDKSGSMVRGLIAGGEWERLNGDDFRDPLAAYIQVKDEGWKQIRVSEDRALWRDSLPLYAQDPLIARPPKAVEQAATLVAVGVLARESTLKALALGFATDKAKVLLGRAESLTIPLALLADSSATDTLNQGFACANAAASTLRASGFQAARHALSIGDRSPDLKDIRALASSTGAEPIYWSRLGSAFPVFLHALACKAEHALLYWKNSVRDAAYEGYERVERKLGAGIKGLKAITIGAQTLNRGLAGISVDLKNKQEELI